MSFLQFGDIVSAGQMIDNLQATVVIAVLGQLLETTSDLVSNRLHFDLSKYVKLSSLYFTFLSTNRQQSR